MDPVFQLLLVLSFVSGWSCRWFFSLFFPPYVKHNQKEDVLG